MIMLMILAEKRKNVESTVALGKLGIFSRTLNILWINSEGKLYPPWPGNCVSADMKESAGFS